MTVNVRWEQCCESPGCTKPAHHGALCSSCFRAATPARRAVELLAANPSTDDNVDRDAAYVSDEGAAWLERLWAA
jgi:hypothetical protein